MHQGVDLDTLAANRLRRVLQQPNYLIKNSITLSNKRLKADCINFWSMKIYSSPGYLFGVKKIPI